MAETLVDAAAPTDTDTDEQTQAAGPPSDLLSSRLDSPVGTPPGLIPAQSWDPDPRSSAYAGTVDRAGVDARATGAREGAQAGAGLRSVLLAGRDAAVADASIEEALLLGASGSAAEPEAPDVLATVDSAGAAPDPLPVHPGDGAAPLFTLLPGAARHWVRGELGAAAAFGGSASTSGVLTAVVGSGEWFEQIGSGLRWQVGEGVSEARLRLNPAELGTLDVQVRITERGTEVHFLAPHAQAREALEQGMQRLRESLDAQGMQLADASVSDGRSGRDGRERFDDRLSARSANASLGGDLTAPGEALRSLRQEGRGLIDLYA